MIRLNASSRRLRSRRLRPALILALAIASPFARAAPMGFKDSWMAMGDLDRTWQEGFVNYAFTPRDAFGAGTVHMRSDDGQRDRHLGEVSYTRLLRRWNAPEAQSNLWLLGGVGAVTGNDFAGRRTMVSPGLQLDHETTRRYLSAQLRLYRAAGLVHDVASARAGFSFFEVDYDQTQPWLIVELRRMRGLSDRTEVTPMLRLVHNRYFVEVGISNSSLLRTNFMYVF